MSSAKDPTVPQGKSPVGVYVHFPWCLKKCPYCDFLSVARERDSLPHLAYADAVIAELGRRRSELGPRRLDSVFFGGGTPSLWEPAELGRVLRAILDTSPGGAVEVTVECNPTSLDADRARALRDVGVNRVSIGVQSLNDERLAFLGRLHDAAGGLRAVKDAVRAGVQRVSADLIFGVAGQTPEDAAREARILAELGIEHISAYALTIEPGTQFGALARRGKLPLATDDNVAECFLAVDQTLTAAGFEHYEISNYCRGDARARHNVGYWVGNEYLGLGTGAWGTWRTAAAGRQRYRNTPVPERYLSEPWTSAELFATGPLISEVEPISDETALRERLLLALRLAEGIDLDASCRDLDVHPFTPEREHAIERLVARGRLVREGTTLRIPKSAWLHADGTIAALF